MSAHAIPYWHVDAFAARAFAGNQAAVMVLDEWLADDILLAIAEENKFAETAFVVRDETGTADWKLRWFMPELEVELCGHATLASGHVLLTRDGGERVTFATRESGVLEVRRSAAGYELGLPAIPTSASTFDEVAPLLGGEVLEVARNDGGYNIFRYASEAEIRALTPDFRALAAFGTDQFICTAPGETAQVVSRVFLPGSGVDEDSATGSAHAALTCYWADRLGRDSFTAHQASARGADFTCRLEGDRVWLGGPCTTVVEGTFYLSG